MGEYMMRLEAVPAESAAVPAPEPAVKSASERPASREPTIKMKTEPGDPAKPDITLPVQPATKPPAVSPVRPESPPSYDAGFGLPRDNSRYLQYLPPIYGEYPFLGSFLLAFEGVLTPLEQIVDNFDLYLDPKTTPAFFMGQLAHWLSLTIDEKWPLEKQRAILAEAAELYRRRGTRWSLIRYLEIYTGLTAEISEPEKRPHFFEVTLRLPKGQTVDRATVERIIRASKPAHTIYNLQIVQQ
jgi:phage tail-like protein